MPVLLLLLAAALFPSTLEAQPAREQPVGAVLAATHATLLRRGDSLPLAARAGDLLFAGDSLRTAGAAASLLFCPENASLILAPNSLLVAGDKRPVVRSGRLDQRTAAPFCALPAVPRDASGAAGGFTNLTVKLPEARGAVRRKRPGAPPPSPSGKTYALVVGVSRYLRLPPDKHLRYAHQDAAVFEQHLKSPRGGSLPDRNIMTLTDSAGTTGAIGSLRKNRVNQTISDMLQVQENAEIIGLLASGSNELSFESSRFGGGHGAFSYFLLSGLNGEADANRDGVVEVEELIQHVREKVRVATRTRQNPRDEGAFYPDSKLAEQVHTKLGIELKGWTVQAELPRFRAEEEALRAAMPAPRRLCARRALLSGSPPPRSRGAHAREQGAVLPRPHPDLRQALQRSR